MNKKTTFTIILLCCISLTIGLFLNIDFTKGYEYDDIIEYDFENEIVHNINNPTYDHTLNVKDSFLFNQDYLATYSFTNDIIGGNPISWSLDESGGSIDVINNHNNHNKVLCFNDISNSVLSKATQTFIINHSFGSLEFWLSSSDLSANKYLAIGMKNGLNRLTEIYLGNDNKIAYLDSGGWVESGITSLINMWYHFRMDFECTEGGYLGLSQYRWNLYINGQKFNDITMYNDDTEVNKFSGGTAVSGVDYNVYLDAVGYSWNSSYTIGQNSVPDYSINSNIKEVNVYEFAFEGFQDLYDIGSSNPSGWIEDDPSDYITIIEDTINDRKIYFAIPSGVSYTFELYKEFNILNGILNISWKIEIGTWGQNVNEFAMNVLSYDDTELTYIFLENNQLKYDDGTSYIVLASGLSSNKEYEFEVYLNTYDGLIILNFYEDSIYQDTFYLKIMNHNKHGLGKLIYSHYHLAGIVSAHTLDYIGIYVNGTSLSTEFGLIRSYDIISNPKLYFSRHNFYHYTLNKSTIAFYLTEYPYVDTSDPFSEVCTLDNYDGSIQRNRHKTLYDLNDYISNPILWILFYNQLNPISNIYIEGIKVIENINDIYSCSIYPTVQYQSQLDGNYSYYYVDNSNRLCSILNITTNGLVEYMELSIDFIDMLGLNRSLSYNSWYNGIGISGLQTYYTDSTIDTYRYSTYPKRYNIMLVSDKILHKFWIYTTDYDLDIYTNYISRSYIYNLKIQHSFYREISLLTLDLITIMIPIIILFIPTIAIYFIAGKKSIIPMLILMNIICFISDLIPLEIFFIIIFALVCGIFIQYKKSREVI